MLDGLLALLLALVVCLLLLPLFSLLLFVLLGLLDLLVIICMINGSLVVFIHRRLVIRLISSLPRPRIILLTFLFPFFVVN